MVFHFRVNSDRFRGYRCAREWNARHERTTNFCHTAQLTEKLYRLNNDVSITGEFFKDDLLPLLCSEIDFDSIKKFSIKPNEIQNISNFISDKYSSIPTIPSTPTVNIISDLINLTSDENKTGNGDVSSSTNQATMKDEDISIDEMILDADSNIINNYEQTLLDPNPNFNILNSLDFNEVGFASPPPPLPPPN